MDIAIVKDKVERLWLLRQEKQLLKESLDDAQKRVDEAERELIHILSEAEMERFDADSCTVSRQERTSWRVPKEPAAKRAFFDWLKDKGVFEDLVTVQSQTLNALCREEERLALDRGEVMFRVPGLEEPTVYETLSVRKR